MIKINARLTAGENVSGQSAIRRPAPSEMAILNPACSIIDIKVSYAACFLSARNGFLSANKYFLSAKNQFTVCPKTILVCRK
jgi:hypothetical protein